MITHDPEAFAVAFARAVRRQRATADALLLVRPVGMRVSSETASDNAYMDAARSIDAAGALAEHRSLERALIERTGLPVAVFDGNAATPDAVFPNNVFASVPGTLIVGAMRHPERRREAERGDIPAWFSARGAAVVRLADDPRCVAELTGALVIDRARNLGFIGLSERCSAAGAEAMHCAFGLDASLIFELAPGEYHTNVVLALLAGRAAIVAADGFADPRVPALIGALYSDLTAFISAEEKSGFVANAISPTPDQAWISARAERALGAAARALLRRAGFVIHTVALEEIEKAGGSMRCCIAEVFDGGRGR